MTHPVEDKVLTVGDSMTKRTKRTFRTPADCQADKSRKADKTDIEKKSSHKTDKTGILKSQGNKTDIWGNQDNEKKSRNKTDIPDSKKGLALSG